MRAGITLRLVLLAALGVGCGAVPTPRSCTTSSGCPEGALCQGGVCVADQPPAAAAVLSSSPTSNVPLVLDGSGSHDPDAGDSISSWSWTIAPAGSGCDAEPPSGSAEKLPVVFPCAGDFDVTLVVRDSVGTPSPAATERVHVAPSTDPPQVSVSGDLALDHRCGGSPVLCTAWDGERAPIQLSASASAPAGVSFSYHWAAIPPAELSAQPAPRISFLPGPDVASPTVLVETDGTAIAGRYAFTVAATDSRGMVAVGRVKVTIGNRPPVIAGGGTYELPHAYDPATRTFVASGRTPSLSVTDPDGDPVTSLGFAFTHAGDGGATFSGQDQGDHATLSLAVPYRSPSDAALLIGPAVVRRADLTVVDANGASATAGFAVVVTNRAPRLAAPVAAASVNHSFDAAGSRYLAVAPLSTWVDDDGDPLYPAVSGDAVCPSVVEQQGTAWVTCSLPFAGAAAVGAFAGAHPLSVSMADPFGPGATQATTLTILNRAPRLLASSALLPAACTPTAACCESESGKCAVHDVAFGGGSATVALVQDDDGDPVSLSLGAAGCLSASVSSPGAAPCPAGGCAANVSLCALSSQCMTVFPEGTLSVTASDGLDFAQGAVAVSSVCK